MAQDPENSPSAHLVAQSYSSKCYAKRSFTGRLLAYSSTKGETKISNMLSTSGMAPLSRVFAANKLLILSSTSSLLFSSSGSLSLSTSGLDFLLHFSWRSIAAALGKYYWHMGHIPLSSFSFIDGQCRLNGTIAYLEPSSQTLFHSNRWLSGAKENFFVCSKYLNGWTCSIPFLLYWYTAGNGRNRLGKTLHQSVSKGWQQVWSRPLTI